MSDALPRPLWIETPLVYSTHISTRLGCNVYLKLETLQPSQSFKSRGISLFAQRAKDRYGSSVHLIAASGGNAGVAAACAANLLRVRCTIFLPEGVPLDMIERLKRENAQVVIQGSVYTDALQAAATAVESDEHALMVPAYDHPTLWEGHGTLVRELASQLTSKPDAIVCSVGGGGLLGGIIHGCHSVAWDDVPIVAMETHDANCFYQSIAANRKWPPDVISHPPSSSISLHDEHKVFVAQSKPTSQATSLGATSPASAIVKAALDRIGAVNCITIADVVAMQSACRFAEEHKILIELACATAFTSVYEPEISDRLLTYLESLNGEKLPRRCMTLVIVVCGGTKISVADLIKYGERVNAERSQSGGRTWTAMFNGERVSL